MPQRRVERGKSSGMSHKTLWENESLFVRQQAEDPTEVLVVAADVYLLPAVVEFPDNLTAIYPQTEQAVSLFNPRADSWADHFVVQGTKIVGLASGKWATVRLFNMNADERAKVKQ